VKAEIKSEDRRNWKQPRRKKKRKRGSKPPRTDTWTKWSGVDFASVKCRCPGNYPAFKRTWGKNGPNKGREFWCCSGPYQCGFFKWESGGGGGVGSSGAKPSKKARKQSERVWDKYPWRANQKFQEDGIHSSLNVNIEIVSIRPPILGVSITPFQTYPQLINIIKLSGGSWAQYYKRWHIPFHKKEDLVANITNFAGSEANITAPPRTIMNNATAWAASPLTTVSENSFDSLPPLLNKMLYKFQREGFKFVIAREGRAIIADEMGLGKTVQAIACALYYRVKGEWPLLVICPSSLKYYWRDEILKWTRDLKIKLDPRKIKIISTEKEVLFKRLKMDIYIMSYTIAALRQAQLVKRRFKVVIVDESHVITNKKGGGRQVFTKILYNAKRCILLSGKPMSKRPIGWFAQIDILRKGEFMGKRKFSIRYCDGHKGSFGWDGVGATHTDELHCLLKERIMIRRLKSEVLDQLPDKQRTIVIMPITDNKAMSQIKNNTSEIEARLLEAISNNANVVSNNLLKGDAMKYYTLTSLAKTSSVCEYVLETARSGEKFLVFCYHVFMMDALEKYIKEKIKCGYVRIDEKTNPNQRNKLANHFQSQAGVKIAILSITAAGVGLTLTAARIVLFAELFWCPSNLLQCEDRVRRIGQKNCVNIYYLLGENTIDEVLWPMIKSKVEVAPLARYR